MHGTDGNGLVAVRARRAAWPGGAAMANGATFTMFALMALLALIALIVPAGCATGKAAEADRTGGVKLTMEVEMNDHARSYYRLETDGILAYAGGRDAERRTPSWRGELREEEIAELRRLLEKDDWLARGFPSAASVAQGSAGGVTYEVDLRTPRGSTSFTLRGRHPAVTAMHDLLDQAARRRFEPILESLPKAGEQRPR